MAHSVILLLYTTKVDPIFPQSQTSWLHIVAPLKQIVVAFPPTVFSLNSAGGIFNFRTLSIIGNSDHGISCKTLFGLFVDASTDWGIGIVFNSSWAAFCLCPNWKIPGCDICWLETVAIELLIYFLELMNFHNIYLLIHSDNQGTIGAFDKARSPNYWINMSIHRMCSVIGPLFIQPKLEYIPTALNPASCAENWDLSWINCHLLFRSHWSCKKS